MTQFNPDKPKQFADHCEGARVQFTPQNKSCLSQCVSLENILKLLIIRPTKALFIPIYEGARFWFRSEKKVS